MDIRANSRATALGKKRPSKRKKLNKWLGFLTCLLVAGALGLVAWVCYMEYQQNYNEKKQAQLSQQLATQSTVLAGASTTTSVLTTKAQQLTALKVAADAFMAEFPYPSTADEARVADPIGRIVIPKIGVDKVLVQGAGEGDDNYLKVGPGHWPETAFPGQGNNCTISGHRTTWDAPFRRLNELLPGDEIVVEMPYATVRYVVTRVFVVDEDKAVSAVKNQGAERISLLACHPLGHSYQRIIVLGDMLSFELGLPRE
jgi:sortase A